MTKGIKGQQLSRGPLSSPRRRKKESDDGRGRHPEKGAELTVTVAQQVSEAINTHRNNTQLAIAVLLPSWPWFVSFRVHSLN